MGAAGFTASGAAGRPVQTRAAVLPDIISSLLLVKEEGKNGKKGCESNKEPALKL